jgi:hypothetical protein
MSCTQIVEIGLRLFEKELEDKPEADAAMSSSDLSFAAMKADPKQRESIRRVMSAIAKHAMVSMTEHQRKLRSSRAGIETSKKMTPKQRKQRAQKAALARWSKKT